MSDKLQTSSELKPVSFTGSKPRLTDAQKALLILLKDRMNSNEMISREDIVDFYIKHIKKSETYEESGRWDYEKNALGEYRDVWRYYPKPITKRYRDEWNFNSVAMTWFKQNLGGVIIKGRVMAVPLFED